MYILVDISDEWSGERLLRPVLGFFTSKHVLVFSVVCLLLPFFFFTLLYCHTLYSVACFVWKLVKSFTLRLICLVYVKID